LAITSSLSLLQGGVGSARQLSLLVVTSATMDFRSPCIPSHMFNAGVGSVDARFGLNQFVVGDGEVMNLGHQTLVIEGCADAGPSVGHMRVRIRSTSASSAESGGGRDPMLAGVYARSVAFDGQREFRW
jgi:hypothetical protein